jgi:riboflavin synthase
VWLTEGPVVVGLVVLDLVVAGYSLVEEGGCDTGVVAGFVAWCSY